MIQLVSPEDILLFANMRLACQKLNIIHQKYKSYSWYKLVRGLMDKIMWDLMEDDISELTLAEQKSIGITQPDAEPMLTNKEMDGMLIALKHVFEPQDYLFLRSMITENDEDTYFFLYQAQMINPEDLILCFMISFLKADCSEKVLDSFNEQNQVAACIRDKPSWDYFSLLSQLHDSLHKEGKNDPERLKIFLHKTKLHVHLKYGFIRLAFESLEAKDRMSILEYLPHNERKFRWEYYLEMAEAHFDLEEYKHADCYYEYFKKIGPEFYFDSLLEYRKTVILRNTGKEGEAIISLVEIVDSFVVDEVLDDHSCYAVMDLARYYVNQGLPDEASRALSKLSELLLEYLPENKQKEYYQLRGDYYMLVNNSEEANLYYEKAFQIR